MKRAKKKIKCCENCAFFKLYYRAGVWTFWEENHGKCSQLKKVIDKTDCCQQFKARKALVRLSLKDMDAAIENVKYMYDFFNGITEEYWQ